MSDKQGVQVGFSIAEIDVIFVALCMFEDWDGPESEWPEFSELKQAFMPGQEDTREMDFNSCHFLILLNSLGLLYGLTSQRLYTFEVQDGSDLTESSAAKAKELIERIYGWLQLDPVEIDDMLIGCQELAKGLVREAAMDALAERKQKQKHSTQKVEA